MHSHTHTLPQFTQNGQETVHIIRSKTTENRWVLSYDLNLKAEKVWACHTEKGSLFQMEVPVREKARCPWNFLCLSGIDLLIDSFYVLITFELPWYDLRGWLGVKNQLSICPGYGTNLKTNKTNLLLPLLQLPFQTCQHLLVGVLPRGWLHTQCSMTDR